MHLQCFTPTRTYNRDDHYPICTKLNYGCLLALCVYLHHVEFSGHFFFCLVYQPRLLVKLNNLTRGSNWSHNFLYGHVEWIKTRNLTERNFDSRLWISYCILTFSLASSPGPSLRGRRAWYTRTAHAPVCTQNLGTSYIPVKYSVNYHFMITSSSKSTRV